MNRFLTIILLVGCSVISCDRSIKANDLMAYLNDPDNGLVQEKFVGGLHLRVKYLPKEYLIYKDLRVQKIQPAKQTIDSLGEYYKNADAFLLSIQPDTREGKGGDIMLTEVTSKGELWERVMDMNFDIEHYISLFRGSREYSPSLVALENVYGLQSGRNVNVAFIADPSYTGTEDFIFEFNDEIFNTGISRFRFKQEDLKTIPDINYQTL